VHYYGYRYLNTEMGRWVSRDPIEEIASLNVLSFVANTPCNGMDFLGLVKCPSWLTLEQASATRPGVADMLAYMDAHAGDNPNCKRPKIKCHKCGDGGSSKCGGNIHINGVSSGNATQIMDTLVHELIHMYDCCRGRLTNSCDSPLDRLARFRAEIRAYANDGQYSPPSSFRLQICQAAMSSLISGCKGTEIPAAEQQSLMSRCMNPTDPLFGDSVPLSVPASAGGQ
jgi:hypothetical protein